MLMVVAMASFLFVGCLGVTPPINTTPVITTTALPNATVGTAYAAAVAATDADNDALTFTLITGPTGMVISTAGAISGWTPTATGTESIKVAVTDGTDSVSAVFTITVVAADIGPIASVTPVIKKITDVDGESIINLFSSATQYMNKADVAGGILVKGSAPKYSTIKVYVDDGVVGTGYSYGVYEEFVVFVPKTDLGVDGARTLYATATEVALAESTPSTVYAFTLDTVAPEIEKVAAEVGEDDYPDGTVTVTFSEELDADTVDTAADIDDWTVNFIHGWDISIDNVELVSPKVVELEADFGGGWESDIIRVAYEDADAEEDDPTPITDLAGNPAEESSKHCYLEIEGEYPWPHERAEITVVGISTFYIDTPGMVTFEIEANDDEGKNVLTYFTVPVGLTTLEYLHEDGVSWEPLPFDKPFGPSGGYPLIDAEVSLKATFSATGTFKTTVEIWKVDEEGEKDYRLCSKVIYATVIPAPSE